MRLSKIRIAGFKSFVDPVTIDLRSPLVGILGPNGCGKSNTIDAVRWVMGESSAKNLRGQSMEDVIFNGSSSRKPIGQASVELIFDNSDGGLGGEFAQFSEISIKRQASRDGKSTYFLNGTRCRRRDITDIFLGTGLGPRSYAIIEQGMISRLIEAKPEELRNTLEEAAGISRYKERRKETETRMRHTRENLERLGDLREEVDKQLKRLDKQAQAAEKYKTLRTQERELEAQYLLLQWQALEQQTSERLEQLSTCSEQYQLELAQAQGKEEQVTELREQVSHANASLNQIQASYYQAGSEISRLEQSIQHQKELQQRQQESLAQLEQAIEESKQHELEDQMVLEDAQEQILELTEEETSLIENLELAVEKVQEAELVQGDWQSRWDTLQQAIAEPTREAQVEKARIEQLERQSQQLNTRLERLQQEASTLADSHDLEDMEALSEELLMTQESLSMLEDSYESLQLQLPDYQQRLQNNQQTLDQQRSEQQQAQGRLASLETLQNAALQQDNEAQQTWLQQNQWQDNLRLAACLSVEAGWELAVETVLQHDLDAIAVDDLPLDTPLNTSVFVSDIAADDLPQRALTRLSDKVTSPQSLQERLALVFCADSMEQALQQRSQLQVGESIICRDGTWLGKSWLRTTTTEQGDSVLKRQQEMTELQTRLENLEQSIHELDQQVAQDKQQLNELTQQSQQHQSQINQTHRQATEQSGQLKALQQKAEQLQQRRDRIQSDIEELRQFQSQYAEEQLVATEQRNEALAQLEQLLADKAQLEALKTGQQHSLESVKREYQTAQEVLQQHKLAIESYRQQQESSQRQLERVVTRLQQLQQQYETLQQQINMQTDPSETLLEDLQLARETRAEIEMQLMEAREQVEKLELSVRQTDEERLKADQVAEASRNRQEQLKLDWQALHVKTQTLAEQFEQLDVERETLLRNRADDCSIEQLETELQTTQKAIEKLGAINLAAIEEFNGHNERKAYLDQQNDDLVEALETLEKAIRKIDRETRARFKATFEQVNQRLMEMFPNLFGGGECYLEMTSDDLLTTGVAIMARPPGKRLSSIHLMSGGEKALTAVALVFAIFELNPAPFCMLDEVDAPLDEANVGRFCDLVRQMSERVQFIFITHNRATMELAENLIGVTMREPGVSRLVSVDIAEATQFANG